KADRLDRAGMQLRNSRDCIITNNYFFNNSDFGLDLIETSIYNKVYFNKFIDNDLNAVDDCLHNRWDDGVIGNYWEDYEDLYVPPATNDGFIWDIPYEIGGVANSEDNKPLYVFLEALYPHIIEFEINDEYLNTTTPLETDKALQINCRISDYFSIDWVYLCENSTGLYQNHSMYSNTNNKWTYDLDISSMERGSYVSFSFYAIDNHRNLRINNNGNLNFTIRIGDYNPPVIDFEISNDYLNTTAPFETENNIQINCSVSDYSSIEWVYLCENTTGVFQNHSMSKGLNGDWTYNLDISLLNEGDNFKFFFYSKDLYSNIGINNNNGNNFTIFYGDSDNDGMPNGWEILYNLNPLIDDSSNDNDGDDLSNLEEFESKTIPIDPDSDNDGLPDGWEVHNGLDPLIKDSSLDPDKDSLTNIEEYQYNTQPFNNDTDTDDLFDGEEVYTYNTNPLSQDSDTDGLHDGEEIHTYNTNPLSQDTDTDGLLDGEEVQIYNTNPLSQDTDNDRLPDRWEVQNGLDPLENDANEDLDGDGLINSMEYNYTTNPQDPDTDNDGLSDGEEINTYLTHPNNSDTDNDGLSDGDEISIYLTDPNDSDTDNDGYSDGAEISAGTNPNDPYSNPLSPYIMSLIVILGISSLIILNLIFYALIKRSKLKR
ncbi:MAG: binary toxin-like calcium binding domain-containing protein, partial [Candidatus Odinarchaeota archaeon]